jgi:hypothetical protein
MAILKKERVPCCGIEDKHIDALLEKDSPSLSLDLALLVTITRFEIIPPLSDLSELFKRPEIEIECSLNNLADIGFLSLI